MKQDQRGRVLELLRRQIPRAKSGDPAFTCLGHDCDHDETLEASTCLLKTFTPEEVVLLCNRAIYQAEYQRSWHRRWEREKAEELAPLKAKVCEMFNLTKWTMATEDQLRAAKQALAKEKH